MGAQGGPGQGPAHTQGGAGCTGVMSPGGGGRGQHQGACPCCGLMAAPSQAHQTQGWAHSDGGLTRVSCWPPPPEPPTLSLARTSHVLSRVTCALSWRSLDHGEGREARGRGPGRAGNPVLRVFPIHIKPSACQARWPLITGEGVSGGPLRPCQLGRGSPTRLREKRLPFPALRVPQWSLCSLEAHPSCPFVCCSPRPRIPEPRLGASASAAL